MLGFDLKAAFEPDSKQASQHLLWEQQRQCVPAPTQTRVAAAKERSAEMPAHYVTAATAQRFLRQIGRELREWLVITVNSAEAIATAALNIIMLSIVAVFAFVVMLVLVTREQVMDKPPKPLTDANQKHPGLAHAGEPRDGLT